MTNLGIIYKFDCIVTHRVYIGQTTDIINRLKSHLRNSSNISLREDIKLYGIDSFTFSILEFITLPNDELLYKDILNKREQYFLNTVLKANKKSDYFEKFGYNISRKAGYIDYNRTQAIKTKMSNSRTGNSLSSEHIKTLVKMGKQRFENGELSGLLNYDRTTDDFLEKLRKGVRDKTGKPILQYDLEGNFIKKWNTIIEASKYFKPNKPRTAMAALSRSSREDTNNLTAYNFMWKRWYNDMPIIQKINPVYLYRIKLLDSNKNLIKVFNRPLEVARFVNMDVNTVLTIMSTYKHHFSKGYYFIKEKV